MRMCVHMVAMMASTMSSPMYANTSYLLQAVALVWILAVRIVEYLQDHALQGLHERGEPKRRRRARFYHLEDHNSQFAKIPTAHILQMHA